MLPMSKIAVVSLAQRAKKAVRLPRDRRREQLLGVAREVFVSQGYHSASMDDIAWKAGVSKPVLYQHFPSKLDLYLALLDSSARDLIAAVKNALTSTTDNHKRVLATIDAYFSFVDDDAETFRLLFETDLFNEREVRDRVEKTDDDCAELLSGVIAEDTGLPINEAGLLAFALIGMAQTSARRWLRNGDEIPRDRAGWLLASLGWRGISGFPRNAESKSLP